MDIPPPTVLKKPLIVPHKTLLGAGPANCSPRVLHSLSQPLLGHLHTETTKMMDEVKEGIRYVFQTRNDLTLALSTSGHGGMEAVLCNLIEDGDKVLIVVNGIWGERAADMAKRYGGNVSLLMVQPGSSVPHSQIEASVARLKPVLVFIVQGESSTGVLQPLEGLGDICHKHGALLAVDCVASLGGVDMFCDRWGIDALYTGSQKVLGAPPGITPITFSAKAQERIFARKSLCKVFYWDMKILGDYWNCFGRPRVYHHTISATLLYGLREGLAMVAEEGLENVIQRHKACSQQLRDGLQQMGLELYVENPQDRLDTITTIKVPENLDWGAVIAYAMKNNLVEIAGGLGPTVGKVFRIGIMGYNAQHDTVQYALQSFKEALDHVNTMQRSKM